jgi:spoIIIJ-associated protein
MTEEDIKKTIENLLKLMSVEADQVLITDRDNTGIKIFSIKTRDSGILIGNKGENLFAFNHIVKKMAKKGLAETEDGLKFIVDVNDYQERLAEELKNKAKIMCERARSFKVNIEMDPMSSYERMLVHACLQGEPGIKTESSGEGRERRVVIKYIE